MTTARLVFRCTDTPCGADAHQYAIVLLNQAGLPLSAANRVVDQELEFTEITAPKNLSALSEGQYTHGEWVAASPVSRAAGAKIAAFLRWDGKSSPSPTALTPEESSLVWERTMQVSVREGFFDRIATYATTQEQVLSLFKLFRPTVNSATSRCEEVDAERRKSHHLVAAAADILGIPAAFKYF